VKFSKIYSINYFLLFAISLVYSTGSYASSSKGVLNYSGSHITKPSDQKQTPLFVEVKNTSEGVTTISENEFLPFGDSFFLSFDFYFTSEITSSYTVLPYFRDQRKCIAQQIFPFHFFW